MQGFLIKTEAMNEELAEYINNATESRDNFEVMNELIISLAMQADKYAPLTPASS